MGRGAVIAEHIPAITPARVIAEIEHRLGVLDLRGDANRDEAERLRAERARWALERDEILRQHIEHAAKMARVHSRIAADHRRRLEALERQARAELMEAVSAGDEAPSTNGKGN